MAEIRARVRRFRAMTIDQKMQTPGFAYGCMADEAFLVSEIDDALRRLAHAGGGLTPATAMNTVPLPLVDDRFDAGWNAALAAATTQAESALVQAMRDNANPYDTRQRTADALAALRHGVVAPRPPAEPPPFTT